jgi:hypothetical protein
MTATAARFLAAAMFLYFCPKAAATDDLLGVHTTPPAVSFFVNQWRAPAVIALTPGPLALLSTAPSAWRDARWPRADLETTGVSLMGSPAPREFGVRLQISETDTAFIKVLSFRGNGPRSISLRAVPYLPQTILDRPAAKAFAAGVKLRF